MFELALVIVLTHPSKFSDLMEGVVIGDLIDALADGQLAKFVLSGDFLLTSHGFSKGGSKAQFVKLVIPGHE